MVGASPSPSRESHGVMRYLLREGYRVIPVRPDCDAILGVPCVPTLAEIDEQIDLVDVFRRPEFCAQHAREAAAAGGGRARAPRPGGGVARRPQSLWLHVASRWAEARSIAEAGGLDYVEDACTAALHARHL